MDNKAKQALINQLSKTSISNHPLMIKYRGTTLATVLPVEDHQKFQAEREEKLKDLKTELNSILSLIRSHTRHQSLAEVEAQLAALRDNIEQEMG